VTKQSGICSSMKRGFVGPRRLAGMSALAAVMVLATYTGQASASSSPVGTSQVRAIGLTLTLSPSATATNNPAASVITGVSVVRAVHQEASAATALRGVFVGDFTVTCYSIYGETATGVPTSMAVVAVDPSVIPLGSSIFIGGVGTRLAADTGGAIYGNRLDIWEPSISQCDQFGVRRLPVWKS